MTDRKPVDFDEYADQYESLLKNQLDFFSKNRDYFSEYKVALMAKRRSGDVKKILDFGCGVGLSLPFLAQYFPDAQIVATDRSERSLARVRRLYPSVTVLTDAELKDWNFDLIFVAGVFHHIAADFRAATAKRLAGLLSSRGELFVFEHNPYNVITRYLVATCPFDEDAELLSMPKAKRLLREAGLRMVDAGYCLFFPQMLKALRPMEKVLGWLPLGGQYYLKGSR